MRDLGIDQRLRDHPDHFAPRLERRIGDRAHQPELAAAIDDADPALGKAAPDRARGFDIDRVGRGGRSAIDCETLHSAVSQHQRRGRLGAPDHAGDPGTRMRARADEIEVRDRVVAVVRAELRALGQDRLEAERRAEMRVEVGREIGRGVAELGHDPVLEIGDQPSRRFRRGCAPRAPARLRSSRRGTCPDAAPAPAHRRSNAPRAPCPGRSRSDGGDRARNPRAARHDRKCRSSSP